MSVRKRTWMTKKGKRTAWLVDYTDQLGARCFKQFDAKKDAVAYHDTVKVDVRKGIHTSPSRSPTVSQAAASWIAYVKGEGRERSTVDHYKQHVKLHIEPRMGAEKIAHLSTPRIEAFRDKMLADGLSRPLAKKVLTSLKSLLRDAQRRGNLAHNPAIGVRVDISKRSKRKIEAGVDFPTHDEMQALMNAATGRARALLAIAAFTGLRVSEIRGLPWKDVDLDAKKLHVRQRADAYGEVDSPKSGTSRRAIPFGPLVANALKEWKLASAPKKPGDFVFPSATGGVETYDNMSSVIAPVLIAAGVVVDGEPKYAFHAFRHYYGSWCANRGVKPKVVQERMGHSSIVMTMDVYSHLFPDDHDQDEVDAAERAFM